MADEGKSEMTLPASDDHKKYNETRRTFLKQSSLLTAVALTPPGMLQIVELEEKVDEQFESVKVTLEINGETKELSVEPRETLLDLLRERLDLTGTKKGCDYGQCGACTVHVDGQRINACLAFVIMQEGKKITTIEGLSKGATLHPMQEAFMKHDGFQCGYCTPGQIMSAVACIQEGHANSKEEIREYMSGNLCRCGAYPNIVKAIEEVKNGGAKG